MSSRASQPVRSATVIALALAAILPAPSARAQIADPAGVTNQCLVLINQERAKVGAPPLERQCELDSAAQRQANDEAAHNFLSHVGSDGSNYWDRIARAGYPAAGSEVGGAGALDPAAIVTGWMADPPHRSVVLSSAFKQVGIAVAYGASTQFKYYWCVTFGVGGGRQCVTTYPQTAVSTTSRPLGGISLSNSATIYDPVNKRLYAFVRGGDAAIYYRARQSSATSWEEWKSLGGGMDGNPAAGLLLGGAPTVVTRGYDARIWLRTRVGLSRNSATAAVEDTFSDWTTLGGGVTSDPAVTANADGRAEIFVRGTDNGLYNNWQLANGTWSGWSSLGGGLLGTPAVGINQNGRLAAFVRGTDNGLYTRTQIGAGAGSSWSAWNSIGGGLASDPVVTQLSNGRIAVCYRQTDNTLGAQWQLGPNDTRWTSAASLGSPNGPAAGNPSVVVTSNGRLQLFVRSSGGIIHRRVATTSDPGADWSGWASLQFTASLDPVAFLQPTDGSASLLAVDPAQALWELLPSSP